MARHKQNIMKEMWGWCANKNVMFSSVTELENKLKSCYYGNFSIRKRRDSYNRCSIDFMLSGCKT